MIKLASTLIAISLITIGCSSSSDEEEEPVAESSDALGSCTYSCSGKTALALQRCNADYNLCVSTLTSIMNERRRSQQQIIGSIR